ncbi:MAG TPA: hypothetical protein VK762_02400 [Polyangiaceae bacterium]|jgi:hypothetical protein|nr:hypothetical protein [Polyangiaceae bacterium]
MNVLALAKRRAALRRSEGGAVMFIVAMTLAVLASVGIYALAAAATEVRTSGNERQNTQTHYLSQYGVLGAAHEMVGSRALYTVKLMKSATTLDKNCVSLQGVPTTASPAAVACIRMGSTELGAAWNPPIIVQYGGTQSYTPSVAPGSFGSTPMNGDFFVELTEPMQLSAPARYSTNSNACFAQLTATSIGFTQPGIVGVTPATALFGAEGVETQRARLIAGPLIPCPQ